MKIKKNSLVKIYFNNGNVAEGKIKKWKKKKALIITTGGARLIVFRPEQNIMMIAQIPKEEPLEAEESVLDEHNSPLIVAGVELMDRNGNIWEVEDILNGYATLVEVNSRVSVTANVNELTKTNRWNIHKVIELKPELAPEEKFDFDFGFRTQYDEQQLKKDESLRAKKIADLHLLKKKEELDQASKKIKSFTPTRSPGLQVYDLPKLIKN